MRSPSKKVKSLLRRRLPLALSCLIAAIGLGTAAALALSAAPSPEGPVPPVAEGVPASSIEPALQSSVGLMRRAPTAADVVPASVPVAFSQSSGANLTLARRVAGEGGAEAWIIPGSGSTCILARVAQYRIGGAVCTSTTAARAGELNVQSAGSQQPGAELLAGLVPDGVGSVSMTLADGTTTTEAVHENVYLALVRGAVVAISASGPQGALSIPAMSASSVSPRLASGG
jgi:hypothetical protein